VGGWRVDAAGFLGLAGPYLEAIEQIFGRHFVTDVGDEQLRFALAQVEQAGKAFSD